jgi:hypothetical protein
MKRLPTIDATGLEPEAVKEALLANIRASVVTSAVVGQIVENVSRETWCLVDLQSVRAAASGALHYDVTVRHARTSSSGGDEHRGLSEVDAVLAERALALLVEADREAALELSRSLLTRELSKTEQDPTADSVDAVRRPTRSRSRDGKPQSNPSVIAEHDRSTIEEGTSAGRGTL